MSKQVEASEWDNDNNDTQKQQETIEKPSFGAAGAQSMDRQGDSGSFRRSYGRSENRSEPRRFDERRRDGDRFESRRYEDEDRSDYRRRDDRYAPRQSYGEERTRDDDRYESRRYNDDRQTSRYEDNRRGDERRYSSRDSRESERGRDFDAPRFRSYEREDRFERRPRQTREDPTEPNVTIGIFNLSYNLTQRDFEEFLAGKLAEFQEKYTSKLVIDNMTNRCKGYGFVTFNEIEDSIKAKPLLEQGELMGKTYRGAYSVQKRERRNFDNERPAVSE